MKYFFWLGAFGGVGVLMYFTLFSAAAPITNYPANGQTIVAFGDSLVAGIGATPDNDFVSVLEEGLGQPILNLGVSGDTTSDGLVRLDAVIAQDPKLVIVLFGGNDFLQNVPKAETFANLEEIIQTIHQSGSMVLLLGVRGGLLSDEYSDEFELLAKTHNTAYVSDVLAGVLGRSALMSDRVHPNDAGYQIIAERILPTIEELLIE